MNMSTDIKPVKALDFIAQETSLEIAARYTYEGVPNTDRFTVSVIVGQLASYHFVYDDAAEGYVAPLKNACRVDILQSYNPVDNRSRDLPTLIREGTTLAYDKPMLLRNVVKPEEIEEAVHNLTDRRSMAMADDIWQSSVVGFDNYRFMQRALFVASGDTELDTPKLPRGLTEPEFRANTLLMVGDVCLAGFMCMPPG